MKSISYSAICIAMLLAHSATVSAQQAAEPPVAAPALSGDELTQRNTARTHFRRGVELIRNGQWADARVELEAARDIRATPPVHFNLALAYRALGLHRGAVSSLRAFMQAASELGDPAVVAQAETALRDSLSAICRVDVSIEPAAAVLRIDGAVVDATERAISLDPGDHTLSATLDGHTAVERRVTLRRGQNLVFSLRLVPTAQRSFLRIETNEPLALVRIDGREVGTGTLEEIVQAGHHYIDVTGPHHWPFAREIDTVVGQRQVVSANLRDRRTVFESPWFWVVTGAVVAAGVTTAVLLWPAPPPIMGTLNTVDAPGRTR
ncbi:MAG: PEGA domain-containing protein [Deltaproteobacteria bacterium]|nr:PEGA domain-containing protein [Deltaproteobacteria bacterium]